MLSFLYKLATDYEREHGYRPNSYILIPTTYNPCAMTWQAFRDSVNWFDFSAWRL